jgi:hypothetical protein
MSRASSLVFPAFTVILGAAATATAQTINPFVAPFPHGPILNIDQTPLMPDEASVFSYIATTLHLGSTTDSDLIQRLEASSSIDHLHDYRGEGICAVKPELLRSDGVSQVRAADGNYPFFVFRQSEHGWLLLGQMQGSGYEWSTQTRHLVFNMSVLDPNGPHTVVRYEVNPGYLANLTEIARAERQHDRFKPNVEQSF